LKFGKCKITFILGLIRRFGLLKTAAIGDTVLLTAIIRDILDTYPQSKIVLFAGNSNYEFAKLLKNEYKNLEVEKLPIKNPLKSIKMIKSYKLDLLFDFGAWPRLNAILTYFSNPKYSVGFKTDNQYRHYGYDAYINHSKNLHELENYKNVIKKVGINKNNNIYLKRNSEINEKIVVLHMFPGGMNSYMKEWSIENWVKIIDYLSDKNYQIYLTGAPVDKIKAEKIAKISKNRVEVVAGIYSLKDTITLLSKSKLVISVNTGIMHIASALGCNLISLNGPTSVKRWGPLNKNSIAIQSSISCSPCLNLGFEYGCSENKCMQVISVDEVIKGINHFLKDNNE